MIDKFFSLFKQPSAQRPQMELNLAVAVLLTEILKADHQLNAAEQTALQQNLQRLFSLSDDDAVALMQQAKTQSDQANDLFKFTESINAHWQAEDKFRLLQGLWQVAYSDANLDKYEEHMIRRISELLYIPHSEFIRAKLSVKDKHDF